MQHNQMRISIALCTYNGAQYLQQQLDSFASQTYAPFELVVCDDDSTDATLALIDQFARKVGFPVRIFRNKCTLGSTKNFERAIGICEGDLIALSDQDDEWYPDKLASMHRLFEGLPEALVAFSDADLIDDRSVSSGRRLWKCVYYSPAKRTSHVDPGIMSVLFRANVVTGATVVFRSRFRDEFLPIPDSWIHDGWIAWIAALHGGLAVLPAAKIRYRIHSRQQVGLISPSKRLAHAKKNGLVEIRSLIKQFYDLRQYLERADESHRLKKFIPGVEGKIHHLEGRAALSESFLHRVCWILKSWREYQSYARGPISMLKDSFFVSRETGSAKTGHKA